MTPWFGTLAAALLALGALCSPTMCWGKPADLPGEVTQECWDEEKPEGIPTPPRAGDASEESEAPPASLPNRDFRSTRRNRVDIRRNLRDTNLVEDEDGRREEMLRSTVPLETRPPERYEVRAHSDGLQLAQYYEVVCPNPTLHMKTATGLPFCDFLFLLCL